MHAPLSKITRQGSRIRQRQFRTPANPAGKNFPALAALAASSAPAGPPNTTGRCGGYPRGDY